MPYKILALSSIPQKDRGVYGYMDDGSESYKDFHVDKDNKLHIISEFPKSRYGGARKFAEIMGKFDPETFFIEKPPTVDKLDFETLHDVYWRNYSG